MAMTTDMHSGSLGGREVHISPAEAPMAQAVQRLTERDRGGAGRPRLVLGDESVALDDAFLDLIALMAQGLQSGRPVTVLVGRPEERTLTSQEAADLLNVSRPHVVKLAATGELPHQKVGNRHRFRLSDVLAYDRREAARRGAALAELAPADGYSPRDF